MRMIFRCHWVRARTSECVASQIMRTPEQCELPHGEVLNAFAFVTLAGVQG